MKIFHYGFVINGSYMVIVAHNVVGYITSQFYKRDTLEGRLLN